jgi:pectinesterase
MTIRHVILLVLCSLMGALQAAEPTRIHIVLTGDSTVAKQQGWGNAFLTRLQQGATGVNLGHNGTTTASFRAKGEWDRALAEKPTHVLIQFGHNDSHDKDAAGREADANGRYSIDLARFIDEARAVGATPILVTSLVRRTFRAGKLDDLLVPYAHAAIAVAARKQVPLVDLHARSAAVVERLGETGCAPFSPPGKDGRIDRTHLTPAGGEAFAALVIDEVRRVVPTLAPYLDPAALP